MNSKGNRIIKELANITQNALENVHVSVDDDNLLSWSAIITGTDDIYSNGQFKISIDIPPEYPQKPPNVIFNTPIFHPNIHPKTGQVCLNILKDEWTPAWTIKSVILAIQVLMVDPEPNSPLNCDASKLFKVDLRGYKSMVRYYTLIYAYS